MMTLAQSFLSKSEEEQVTAVVGEVERTTSGEIVPMKIGRAHV